MGVGDVRQRRSPLLAGGRACQRTAAPVPAGRARRRTARLGGRGHRRRARRRCGGVRRPRGAEGHAGAGAGQDAGREGGCSTNASNCISSATSLRTERHHRAATDANAAAGAGRRSAARARAAAVAARSAQMLLDDDRAALATAMEQAAREAGMENIRFFTQQNLYARRILDRMGLRGVERDIEALRRAATTRQRRAPIGWRTGSRRCATQVRDFVERNLLLFARGETEKFREELLKIRAPVQPGTARPGPDARAGARDGEASWRRATPRRGGAGCAGSSTCGARCGATWAGAAFRSSPCGSRSASRSRA